MNIENHQKNMLMTRFLIMMCMLASAAWCSAQTANLEDSLTWGNVTLQQVEDIKAKAEMGLSTVVIPNPIFTTEITCGTFSK